MANIISIEEMIGKLPRGSQRGIHRSTGLSPAAINLFFTGKRRSNQLIRKAVVELFIEKQKEQLAEERALYELQKEMEDVAGLQVGSSN